MALWRLWYMLTSWKMETFISLTVCFLVHWCLLQIQVIAQIIYFLLSESQTFKLNFSLKSITRVNIIPYSFSPAVDISVSDFKKQANILTALKKWFSKQLKVTGKTLKFSIVRSPRTCSHLDLWLLILLCLSCLLSRMLHCSGPQPFWHQGPVLKKTIYPCTSQLGGGGRWIVWGWFKNITSINATTDLTGGRAQVIIPAMGRGCKYRWSFIHSTTAHLLLCGPVPNKPWTGTGLWPRGSGPLLYWVKW